MKNMEVEETPLHLIEMHPYEYLTQINTINNFCNKSNTKSYSSASKVKLPWKSFNLMKIPKVFQKSYQECKKLIHKDLQKDQIAMDTAQRKLWKQHQDILKRYNHQKDFTQTHFRQKSSYKERKAMAKEMLGQSRNESHFFLQKIVEKGGQFSYDKEQLKMEVLNNLNLIKTSNNRRKYRFSGTRSNTSWRAQSAMTRPLTKKKTINLGCDRPSTSTKVSNKQKYQRRTVNQLQYLSFEKGEDLVEKYQENIKQVDCSISSSNVQKAVGILKNLSTLAETLK